MDQTTTAPLFQYLSNMLLLCNKLHNNIFGNFIDKILDNMDDLWEQLSLEEKSLVNAISIRISKS